MKKIIYYSVLLLILLSELTLFSNGQGFSPRVQKRLQNVIDSFKNNPENPFIGGISVAIKVDGLAEWQGATGYSARNVDDQNNLLPGGKAFIVQTLSRIYSVTKTFTAPLVLELAKEGVFKLEDPVSKYLPLSLINPGLNSSVTIKQLLAHESGYSDYTDELNLQIAVAAQPTHVWTAFEMLTFVHQLDAPGVVRKYSSTNYIVLGAIIEVATGKHVEEFYRSRFFDPLELKSMYLAIRESDKGHGSLASPHDNISPFNPVFQQTGQPTFPDTITNIYRFPMTAIASLAFTGGGIVSNVKDVAEWCSALFDGRATGKPIINTMLASISPNPDKDGDRLGYGVILSNKISGIYNFYGHDGNAPGYRSVMFYQPDKKLTIAILTNYHGADIYAIAKALYAVVPDFTCGNTKDDKVNICFYEKNLCLRRPIASLLMRYGAYLGKCAEEHREPYTKSNDQSNSKLKDATALQQNLSAFPNPFNNTISFSFKVAGQGKSTLKLYDMNGKMLATIFNGVMQKESLHTVNFDGSKLPAGMYMIRLQNTSGTSEKKLMKIH
ncbi:MAG TPA: serine hydrolase [Chitinophagaceae bacterium]|nr:serine hydrolase [Chitinophagaceae bacterium]